MKMAMRIPSCLKVKPQNHIMFGNILQLQIIQILRKVENALCMFCEKKLQWAQHFQSKMFAWDNKDVKGQQAARNSWPCTAGAHV